MAAYETSRAAPFGAISIYRFVQSLGEVSTRFSVWNDARVTRKALSKLTDRELDDIGLCRGGGVIVGSVDDGDASMLQMGADPVAALVVAETGDEEDRMVETREPDRDIRGGAADMLDSTFTVPGDDVDEGFTDDEKLRIHPFRAPSPGHESLTPDSIAAPAQRARRGTPGGRDRLGAAGAGRR